MSMKSKRFLIPIFIFFIAALVYGWYGFNGMLTRDNANLQYGAQRMAQGVPPYLSIFNHTVPLPTMIAGFGVMISNHVGWDDLHTVRLIFFVIGCLAVVSVYLLGASLFQCKRPGFFGALIFLGFHPFAWQLSSGPQKKIPMVFFETLNLLMTSQRKWFWAGFFGSLSFLCWQPTAIFPIVTLLLAATSLRDERIRNISRTLSGIGLPLLGVSLYFLYHGAFGQLLDGAIAFNFKYYLGRDSSSIVFHFLRPVGVVFLRYTTMFVPILVGFVMIGYICFWRLSQYTSWRESLVKDKFSPLLLSFPAPVIWSILDFQGPPDFFVFLPYMAIACGFFLERSVDRAMRWGERLKREAIYERVSLSIAAGLCIALITFGIYASRHGRSYLDYQKKMSIEIERRFGKEVKLLSIGVPELLVLLHRKNPTPYVFIINGIDRHIHANVPGGFEGWVKKLEAYKPEVIAFGPTEGTHIFKLMDWVGGRYHQEQIGPWELYVRNSSD